MWRLAATVAVLLVSLGSGAEAGFVAVGFGDAPDAGLVFQDRGRLLLSPGQEQVFSPPSPSFREAGVFKLAPGDSDPPPGVIEAHKPFPVAGPADWAALITTPRTEQPVVAVSQTFLVAAAPPAAGHPSDNALLIAAPTGSPAAWRGDFLRRAVDSVAEGGDWGSRVPALFSSDTTLSRSSLAFANPRVDPSDAGFLSVGERVAVSLLLFGFLSLVLYVERKGHQPS
jgi:hypothetical protein